MTAPLRREAELEAMGPAGAFVLTDEEVAAVGAGAKTFPVRVTVGGTSYALRLARMGGRNLIGLRREIREAMGVALGEVVEIEVARDDAPREVEVPAELAAALAADPVAQKAFDALAYSHRKEYARWIGEAKREQTRTARVEQAVTMIRDGQTR